MDFNPENHCTPITMRKSVNQFKEGKWQSDKPANKCQRQPVGTAIRREWIAPDSLVWHIPSSGKFGSTMVMAVVWIALMGSMGGFLGYILITEEEARGGLALWFGTLVAALFLYLGFSFLLRKGLEDKYMSYRLAVAGGKVSLRKEMFGKSKEQNLASESLESVSQVRTGKEGAKEIFEIQIKGRDGRLQFGNPLTDGEKEWLIDDVVAALSGEANEGDSSASGLTSIDLGAPKSNFSIPIPSPGWNALVETILSSVPAVIMIGILFRLKENIGEPLAFYALLALLTVFALYSLRYTFKTLIAMRQDKRVEGTPTEIFVRTYHYNRVVKEDSFPRSEVTDIRADAKLSKTHGKTWSPFTSWRKARKRVELVVGGKEKHITVWMDWDKANQLVSEVRKALSV